jgi:hypothetical protein
MISLLATVARAAARAAAVAVNTISRPVVDKVARSTSASKRPAVAPLIPLLRALLVTGANHNALPSLAAAAATVAAANTATRAEENQAAADAGDAMKTGGGPALSVLERCSIFTRRAHVRWSFRLLRAWTSNQLFR